MPYSMAVSLLLFFAVAATITIVTVLVNRGQ